jgi:hypothetical protein
VLRRVSGVAVVLAAVGALGAGVEVVVPRTVTGALVVVVLVVDVVDVVSTGSVTSRVGTVHCAGANVIGLKSAATKKTINR